MKFIIIIFIFLLFLIIGFFVYYFYYLRDKVYSDLLYLAEMYKNEVSFSKDNVNKILSEKISNLSYYSRYILNNLNDDYKLFLIKKNDILNIRKIIFSLGHGDIEYEMKNINYIIENIKNINKSTNAELKQKGIVYFKLIILLGIFICILII